MKKIYIHPEVETKTLSTDKYCDFIPVSGEVEADTKEPASNIWDEDDDVFWN